MKVSIEESTLIAIGDAIRAKTGKSDLIAPGAMPAEIEAIETGGGGDLPEEVVFSGSCMNTFANNTWNWMINLLKDRIVTRDVSSAEQMFYYSNELEEILFDINLVTSGDGASMSQCFAGCTQLKSLPNITGRVGNCYYFLGDCRSIREIPESWATNIDWSAINSQTFWIYCRLNSFFYYCFSLRHIPEAVLKRIYCGSDSSNAGPNQFFYECRALDEIVGLRGNNATVTDNMFSNAFYRCMRLKRLVFDTDNGVPLTQNWSNQTINLTGEVGYAPGSAAYFTEFNSGITADKEVKDDATYQALKNDPDWFATNLAYSRYNHDSAVETINSLPDTSAYLATAGGSNTIQFTGASGSATDGGAINTLTEEEIAVAAAKGWTVTLS